MSPHRAGGGTAILPVRLALYASAATLLFVLERLIPNPLPWVRLGLANIVTVVVLYAHGAAAAGLVVALRWVLGGLLAGTLLAPQHLVAAGGAAASLAIMAGGLAIGRRFWSPVGISVLGAAAHALAQLAVVHVVLHGGPGVWLLAPVFLGIAVLTGSLTGWFADRILLRLQAPASDGGAPGTAP